MRRRASVSSNGIAKIIDMSQLRVLADVDELHIGPRSRRQGRGHFPRARPSIVGKDLAHCARRWSAMQRIEPDGCSSTDARVVQVEIELDDPSCNAAGPRPRDARHLPLMALTLPAAASPSAVPAMAAASLARPAGASQDRGGDRRLAPSSSGASVPARCCRWPASPPACS